MQPPAHSPTDPFLGNSISGLFDCALDSTAEQMDPSVVPDNWEPPTPSHIAALLPQYQIELLIGRGGMGAVYKGRQITLQRPIAIKVLPAELARNGEFVARFHREAQLLASLSHQGIVTIFDFGQTTEGHLYFVMEYVDGTDLHRMIHKSHLGPEQALSLTIQICEAMQYAHDMGVIHRDIKPANVLITRDGRAKLADFGLAMKPAEHLLEVPEPPKPDEFDPRDPLGINALRLTKPGTAMGTPTYAAPEVYEGKADSRSDIYALGIMLYEMLTGAPPKDYFPLPSTQAKVDHRIDTVVVKALEIDPTARYQKASEMKLAVEAATKPLPKQAPSNPYTKPAEAAIAAQLAAYQQQTPHVKTPTGNWLKHSVALVGALLIATAVYDNGQDWALTKRLLANARLQSILAPPSTLPQREAVAQVSTTPPAVPPASKLMPPEPTVTPLTPTPPDRSASNNERVVAMEPARPTQPKALPTNAVDALAGARQAYDGAATLLDARLLADLEKVIVDVASDTSLKPSERLKAANKVTEELKAYRERGELPLSPRCREASMSYTSEMMKAWNVWDSACGAVIEECLKSGDIQLANQVETSKFDILDPVAHWELRGINGPGHWFDYFYANGMVGRVEGNPGSWWKIEADRIRMGGLGKDADTDRRIMNANGTSYDGRNTRNNYHYSATRIPLKSTKVLLSSTLVTNDSPTLTWTSSDGRTIQAQFVRLAGESVVLNVSGKVTVVPFSKLAAASIAEAKRLAIASVIKSNRRIIK